MIAEIAVPYVDTRADALSLVLGLDPLPARATLHRSLGGWSVALAVLGASHQVVVAGAGPARFTETVACLPGYPPRLPEHEVTSGYAFGAEVQRLAPGDLAAAVRQLRRTLDAAPDGLVGVFDGAPHAITGLVVEPVTRGVRWRSWHAYPQTGEMVRTVGTLTDTVSAAPEGQR